MGKETTFDGDAYLARIGLSTSVPISEDGLEATHRAHVYTIAFENFDILLGRGIDLSLDRMFNKIILQPRGGYCFELNGLYLQLLQALGFQARPLLARVHRRGDPGGRHHQLSLVNIHGRDWIADVGFGANGLRAPIPFELGRVVRHDDLEFRLLARPPFGTMLQVIEEGRWRDLYSFDLEHVCAGDIDSGNHYTATSPQSFFTWIRVASLPNPNGRVSLQDFNLTVVAGGRVTTTVLEPGAGYLDNVREHFGIIIDADYSALQPARPAGMMN